MKVPIWIAWRYVFSKKTTNIVNIIARVAMVGIAIASAALIIILSAFNGIEEIIISNFNAFNPEIRAQITKGKYFDITDSLCQQLDNLEGVQQYTFVLEHHIVLKKDQMTYPFLMKGVDKHFFEICHLDSFMIEGNTQLKQGNHSEYTAVVGLNVAQKMSLGVNSFTPMVAYAPKKSKKVIISPDKAFNKAILYTSGIFSVDESANDKVLVDLSLAQKLLGLKQQASAIEFQLKDKSLEPVIQQRIENILGERFQVKNRIQQNDFVKILNTERLMIIFILIFVLFLAAFNIVATLTMLIVDKKKDFLSFLSLGLSHFEIKSIFLLNAWFTVLIGAVSGLVLGLLLIVLQMQFSFIRFGGAFSQPYPVLLKWTDVGFVFFIVSFVGFLISFLPLNKFIKNSLK